jgi:heme-degrading monooxygenase HmoA
MPYLIVRHKVQDYARWKPFFDQQSATRKECGSRGGHLYRNGDDSHEVIVVFEWSSLEKAHAFAQSADFRETMQRADGNDQPDLYVVEEVDRFSH